MAYFLRHHKSKRANTIWIWCSADLMSALAQGSQFIVCNNSSLKFPCIWLWMKATGTYLVKFRYEKLGLSRNEWVDRERLFKRRPNFEAGGLVLNHHICLIKGISFFSLRVQGNSNVVLYTYIHTSDNTCRDVGRSEMEGGGHNLTPLVDIGLTDLPKFGEVWALPAGIPTWLLLCFPSSHLPPRLCMSRQGRRMR